MPLITEADLHTAIDARLSTLLTQLSGPLRDLAGALFERRHLLTGNPSPYFHPLAQPVFQSPVWFAQRAGLDAHAALDLVEASIVGYLHVRVHDDWFDEGIGDPGTSMLLAQVLLARHQSLLARRVGSHPAFWALFETTWREYAHAMESERALLAPDSTYGAPQFEQVLLRSQPLVLPAAAALAEGGLWDEVKGLSEFVRLLTRSAQLFNDLGDAAADTARGQHTWVARRLGAAEGVGTVRVRMAKGGLDEILEEAREDMRSAQLIARALHSPEAEAFCEARLDAFDEWQRGFFQRLFSALLSPSDK